MPIELEFDNGRYGQEMTASDSMAETEKNYAQKEYAKSRHPGYEYIPARLVEGASRILEIGCLGGHGLIAMREGHDRRAAWLGVEYSPQWCREASGFVRRHGTDGPNGPLLVVRGDGTRLPCPDGVFELVVCKLVLPYVDNRGLLGEIGRVMAPEGRAV